jgi:DNA-binding NtrC family response regulator
VRDQAPRTPQLIVALECDRPLAPSTRHLLGGLGLVTLGRGPRGAERLRADGVPALALRVPDRAVSSQHARLVRLRERWLLEDADSKNGTRLNGAAVTRAPLVDGDLIEVGHTLFLYRDAVVPVAPKLADAGAADLGAADPTLASFSALFADAASALARVATTEVPVIIEGPTGTGKEVLARALHACSGRRGPFVGVNCGSLPAGLTEAALFGHRRGAFSGAVDDRPGFVRSADRGTLLLDEISELPAPAQVALLRVLQEREVVAVGDSRPVVVDVRVVAAGQEPLAAAVAAGRFRADLFARLSGVTLRIPPLCERREDLGLLLGRLLPRVGARSALSGAAARALWLHDWPLNVRELERVLAAATALAGGGPIELAHLPEPLRARAATSADDRLKGELTALLREHHGNVSAVARAVGKARTQVNRWLKRFALAPDEFR